MPVIISNYEIHKPFSIYEASSIFIFSDNDDVENAWILLYCNPVKFKISFNIALATFLTSFFPLELMINLFRNIKIFFVFSFDTTSSNDFNFSDIMISSGQEFKYMNISAAVVKVSSGIFLRNWWGTERFNLSSNLRWFSLTMDKFEYDPPSQPTKFENLY